MDSVAVADVKTEGISEHRGEGIAFRRLIRGQPGEPENFEWSVIDVGPEYQVPRHRHDFEQLQLVLSGAHDVTPKLTVREGCVAYYPEGTWYGPMQGCGSKILHLQLGGPSASGFLSYDQLAEASTKLANSDRGVFEGGVWRYTDADGKRHNMDAYEAISLEARGRKPVYPPPRYETPILMDPDAFEWSDISLGVRERHLATFHERGLSVRFIALDGGATHILADRVSDLLVFVRTGKVGVGDRVFGPETAMRFSRDDTDRALCGESEAELFVIGLPTFD